MERISREELLIKTATLFSLRATCGRLQVGCVIAQEGRIIVTGYNGPPKGLPHCHGDICDINKSCPRAIHAEANALDYAAKKGIPVEGCDIYITHSPCPTCSQRIFNSGIKRVVFLERFREDTGILFLKNNGVIVQQWNTETSELLEI